MPVTNVDGEKPLVIIPVKVLVADVNVIEANMEDADPEDDADVNADVVGDAYEAEVNLDNCTAVAVDDANEAEPVEPIPDDVDKVDIDVNADMVPDDKDEALAPVTTAQKAGRPKDKGKKPGKDSPNKSSSSSWQESPSSSSSDSSGKCRKRAGKKAKVGKEAPVSKPKNKKH